MCSVTTTRGPAEGFAPGAETRQTLRARKVSHQGRLDQALEIDSQVIPSGPELPSGRVPGARLMTVKMEDPIDQAAAFE